MVDAPRSTSTAAPTARPTARAAQYIRMSTDHQKYSTENQALAIAAYAFERDIEVVRTYVDEARSGVTIARRNALNRLLHEVRDGRADYSMILVYDVSRWGRFQDADEAAYYEFTCKKAGITVEYCGEDFENDGSFIASIAKQLKRIGAGQFSRDLGKKVFAAQCHLARLGFKQGGFVGYALRRELMDCSGASKGFLDHGQRKALQSDRVLLRPGPSDEQEVVRGIFRSFVEDRKCESRIARELNGKGCRNQFGRLWSSWTIRHVLRNENYIGKNVYNRTTFRLGQKPRPNPPDQWIRSDASFPPIVEPALFARAQQITSRRRLVLSNEEMLARLKVLLEDKGELTRSIIDAAFTLPCHTVYIKRFGSLRKAYSAIGYVPEHLKYNDGRRAVVETLVEFREALVDELAGAGHSVAFSHEAGHLTVDRSVAVSVAIARCHFQRDRFPRWSIGRKLDRSLDLIVAARMDEANLSVLDYLVVPPSRLPRSSIPVGWQNPASVNDRFLETLDEVVVAIQKYARFKNQRVSKKRPTIRQRPRRES